MFVQKKYPIRKNTLFEFCRLSLQFMCKLILHWATQIGQSDILEYNQKTICTFQQKLRSVDINKKTLFSMVR